MADSPYQDDTPGNTTATMEIAELETQRLPLSDVSPHQDQIIHGNCIEVLRQMPSESVDLVVTDPPYGISFMGKVWDKALPSVDVWRECLRVLKPGAFAFVMCIPRQDCLSRMIINLEDAGFMVNFSSLLHVFATGFPKAANLSKLADRRAGKEREVLGPKPSDRPNCHGKKMGSMAGGVVTPALYTLPATPEAKKLEGAYAGCQPKPCYEVVLVVMRPRTEKTYLDQALANGHGCTMLDAGRIPYEGSGDFSEASRESRCGSRQSGEGVMFNLTNVKRGTVPQGRFAPNLLVSDDVLNDSIDHRGSGVYDRADRKQGWGGNKPNKPMPQYPDEHGSFSRYFSLDAWAEKNLPESVNRTFPFLIVPKASKSEKNAGLDGLEEKPAAFNGPHRSKNTTGSGKPQKPITHQNNHATVKPIKLMSYLTAIGSRPGDIVLDPYAGSGTTGIAAAIADRRYILIEQDAEYVDIGKRRIAWHVEQQKAEVEAQLDMFDEAAGD